LTRNDFIRYIRKKTDQVEGEEASIDQEEKAD